MHKQSLFDFNQKMVHLVDVVYELAVTHLNVIICYHFIETQLFQSVQFFCSIANSLLYILLSLSPTASQPQLQLFNRWRNHKNIMPILMFCMNLLSTLNINIKQTNLTTNNSTFPFFMILST